MQIQILYINASIWVQTVIAGLLVLIGYEINQIRKTLERKENKK